LRWLWRRWWCGRWKLFIHPLLWCWSNLRCAYGWCLTLVTAVLYYLGNFPDVFPTFDLAALRLRLDLLLRCSLACFLLHGSNRLLEMGWGCVKILEWKRSLYSMTVFGHCDMREIHSSSRRIVNLIMYESGAENLNVLYKDFQNLVQSSVYNHLSKHGHSTLFSQS
jgi:hypothetical protein